MAAGGSLFKPIRWERVVPQRRQSKQPRMAWLQKFQQIAVPTTFRIGFQDFQGLFYIVGQQGDGIEKAFHPPQIFRADPSALQNLHTVRRVRQRLTALHGASTPGGTAGGDFRLMAHRVQMFQKERTFIQAAAVGD